MKSSVIVLIAGLVSATLAAPAVKTPVAIIKGREAEAEPQAYGPISLRSRAPEAEAEPQTYRNIQLRGRDAEPRLIATSSSVDDRRMLNSKLMAPSASEAVPLTLNPKLVAIFSSEGEMLSLKLTATSNFVEEMPTPSLKPMALSVYDAGLPKPTLSIRPIVISSCEDVKLMSSPRKTRMALLSRSEIKLGHQAFKCRHNG